MPILDPPTPFSILVDGQGQVIGSVSGTWNADSPATIGL